MLYDNSMLDWRMVQLTEFLTALPPATEVQYFVANGGTDVVKTILTYGSSVPATAAPGDRIYYRNQRCHAIIDSQGAQMLPTGFYEGSRPMYYTSIIPVEFNRRDSYNDFRLSRDNIIVQCAQGLRVEVLRSAGIPAFGLQLAPIQPELANALDIELVGNFITVFRKSNDVPITGGSIRVYLGSEYRDLNIALNPWCSVQSTELQVVPPFLDMKCAQTSSIRINGGSGEVKFSLNSYHFGAELRDGQIWVTRKLTDAPEQLSAELVIVKGNDTKTVVLTGTSQCRLSGVDPIPEDCVDGPLTNRWVAGAGHTLEDGQSTVRFSGATPPNRRPDSFGIDQDIGELRRARSRIVFGAGKVYQELRFTHTSPFLQVDQDNFIPVSQFVALVSNEALDDEPDNLWSYPHVLVSADGRFGSNCLASQGLTSRARRHVPGHWQIAEGDVVGIAVDCNNPRTPVWISINGKWLGRGDPAKGVNPYQYLAQKNATCYNFCAFFHTAYGPDFAVRLNKCWAYTPPEGFGEPLPNCAAPITNQAVFKVPEA